MSSFNESLLADLIELEVLLHQAEVRSSKETLDALLHEDFLEFGRSGIRYSKAEILEELLAEGESTENSSVIWSQEFELLLLAPSIALLTYKSASLKQDGCLSRYSLRSSIWQLTASAWQMRFHQGTATDAFIKSEA